MDTHRVKFTTTGQLYAAIQFIGRQLEMSDSRVVHEMVLDGIKAQWPSLYDLYRKVMYHDLTDQEYLNALDELADRFDRGEPYNP